ncbi:MAG: ABC transporter ATP-binding protein [Nitrospinae bacterium]|nr:ABC transporter ATP-binding protein [Nitrospinota bacterium]
MPAGPVIELRDIRKTYMMGETKVEALKGVSISLQAGEFTALLGPSGSGKSTLLNICGLLDTPDSGEYLFNGGNGGGEKHLTTLRRKSIGFIFQSFNLIPVMTAYENVEYPLLLAGTPAKERKEAVERILEETGVAAFKHHPPDKLSGGQRQRVAIARALVKKPKLVIADEPTASLDSDTAAMVVDLMKSMAGSHAVTFLIATHDERMSRHCGRAITMADGRLI